MFTKTTPKEQVGWPFLPGDKRVFPPQRYQARGLRDKRRWFPEPVSDVEIGARGAAGASERKAPSTPTRPSVLTVLQQENVTDPSRRPGHSRNHSHKFKTEKQVPR